MGFVPEKRIRPSLSPIVAVVCNLQRPGSRGRRDLYSNGIGYAIAGD